MKMFALGLDRRKTSRDKMIEALLERAGNGGTRGKGVEDWG